MADYDNEIVSSIYSSTIDSLHSFGLPYQVKDELYQRYGQGQFFTDVLRKMGNEFTFTNNTPLYAHEEGWMEQTIVTTDASTGGATPGAPAFITLDPSVVDANDNIRARLYECLAWKDSNNKMCELYIYNITSTSVSVSGAAVETYVLSLKPMNVAVTIGTIPDGSVLSFTGTTFAENTGHPASTARGEYRRAFYDRIIKEKQTITGFAMGTDHYYEKLKNGHRSLFFKAQAEKEFLMDKQLDYTFFVGEENSNSITQTDEDSVARSVRSAKGIWKWMDELAGSLTYGTSDFDFFTLDDIGTYMKSQGVFAKNFIFGVGPDLYTKIENGALDFLRDFSSTDLSRFFTSEDGIGGPRNAALGLNFKVLQKDGNNLMLMPIDSFGNIKGLGNSTYGLNKSGFIIPVGNTSKVDGIGELNNVSIGYNVHNGINRKRVVEMLAGPTGFGAAGKAVHEYDNIKLLYLTHFMPFIMKANQTMQVVPYDTY